MSSLDQDPAEVAKARGLVLVLPEPDQIFIDLDDRQDRKVLDAMLETLTCNGIAVWVEKETKSQGGNAHVYLRFPTPLNPITRIALQACLGSDRTRELLSLLRIFKKMDRPPTAFFEVP